MLERKRLAAVAAALVLASCAPTMQLAPFSAEASSRAAFTDAAFVSFDGMALPANVWRPPQGQEPWAVVLALHGINSSAPVFEPVASWLAAQGVAVYAYDVRGFGRSPGRGFWAGQEAMIGDARAALIALRSRYPNTTIAVMGGSLGAAQAVLAFADAGQPQPDRLVLVAPGVMGWDYLPPGYAPLLRAASIATPWLQLGPPPEMERERPSTNNPATKEAFDRDPLRIRETRMDVLAGAVDLMEAASRKLPDVRAPTAFLYGGKDYIIDQRALAEARQRLPSGARVAMYPEGHHMLLRDLEAPRVWGDILGFLKNPDAPLPSSQTAGASPSTGLADR